MYVCSTVSNVQGIEERKKDSFYEGGRRELGRKKKIILSLPKDRVCQGTLTTLAVVKNHCFPELPVYGKKTHFG